jgi:hypothetical protein
VGALPLMKSGDSELRRLTAFGPTQASVIEVGFTCFCVETCRNHFYSVHENSDIVRPIRTDSSEEGSRLRRQLPVTGGSECPTPTGWTLNYYVRRIRVLVFKQRTHCSERLITTFDRGRSKPMTCGKSNQRQRVYPLPTHSLRSVIEEENLPACITGEFGPLLHKECIDWDTLVPSLRVALSSCRDTWSRVADVQISHRRFNTKIDRKEEISR